MVTSPRSQPIEATCKLGNQAARNDFLKIKNKEINHLIRSKALDILCEFL